MDAFLARFDLLLARLEKMETTLDVLVQQRTVKDWYSTAELASLLGKAEYTVREWCRLGRIAAKKLPGGRGNEGEWRISHDELIRYQRDGLLPMTRQALLR